MDDWRISAVEIEQSTGHVLQDRAFQGEGEVGMCFRMSPRLDSRSSITSSLNL